MAVLTPSALAERWAVSPRTVINLIVRGELRATQIGKQWRIAEADAASYERSHSPEGAGTERHNAEVAS
jgi:excisionase family DNA binding protein